MAIDRADGIGHFNTSGQWSAKGHNVSGFNISWFNTGGRGNRGYVQIALNSNIHQVMTAAKATCWGHAGFYTPARVHTQIMEFRSPTDTHIIIEGYEDGSFAILRAGPPFSTGPFLTVGSTLLGISQTGLWRGNTWHHFAAKCIVDGAAGAVLIYVDGELKYSLTGVNTYCGQGAVSTSQIGYGTNFGASYNAFSDLCISNTNATDADGNPTANTGYLGDVAVYEIVSPIDGDLLQWTRSAPGTGAWSSYMNQNPPDDDATYLSSAAAGNENTFFFPNVDTTLGTIIAIKETIEFRKEQEAFASVKLIARDNLGVNHYGPSLTMPTTYIFDEMIHESDPKDASAWTPTKVDNTQLGIRHQA